MSNYNPAYPSNIPVDDGIKEFITTFYGVSDTPGKNLEWLEYFRDDATLIMATQKAIGKTDIFKLREGMWEKVQARKHSVYQVFPASFGAVAAEGEDVVELMLYGDVVYRLKGSPDGEESTVDWAAHARLLRARGSKEWKFAYYRVYIQR